jgi:hypothetical protein
MYWETASVLRHSDGYKPKYIFNIDGKRMFLSLFPEDIFLWDANYAVDGIREKKSSLLNCFYASCQDRVVHQVNIF